MFRVPCETWASRAPSLPLTADHSKFTPISTDDIARRLTKPQANTNPETNPLPFPSPRKKVKGTLIKKEMEEIESSQFAARAVVTSHHPIGFLFFDIADLPAGPWPTPTSM